MTGRIGPAIVAAGLAIAWVHADAAGTIPVRMRIIKGSRQGPASFDARLEDLRAQLGHLAYQQWQQVDEQSQKLAFNQPLKIPLPGGDTLVLTLIESFRDTVTFEVIVPGERTHSRLTISKDQRIVHQLTPEKGGSAYFVSIRPWP